VFDCMYYCTKLLTIVQTIVCVKCSCEFEGTHLSNFLRLSDNIHTVL